jgi:hypothetical protein
MSEMYAQFISSRVQFLDHFVRVVGFGVYLNKALRTALPEWGTIVDLDYRVKFRCKID